MLGIIIVIVFIIGLTFVTIGLIDGNRFIVVEQDFYSDKAKDDFKFVLFSDLHNKVFGNDNEQVLKAIEDANPEAVFIAGDLLTSQPRQNIEPTIRLIRRLCERWPVYYSMGNHETKLMLYPDDFANQYDRFLKETEHANRNVMQNQHIFLPEKNIDICGLEIERCYYKRFKKQKLPISYVRNLIGDARKDSCEVLLAHNPDYFETYAEWGADFVLSGHIHGGVMKLPVLGGVISPTMRLFPKYDGGLYYDEKSTMLLSRGLGVHSIPLRIFNPGELHVITIHSKA